MAVAAYGMAPDTFDAVHRTAASPVALDDSWTKRDDEHAATDAQVAAEARRIMRPALDALTARQRYVLAETVMAPAPRPTDGDVAAALGVSRPTVTRERGRSGDARGLPRRPRARRVNRLTWPLAGSPAWSPVGGLSGVLETRQTSGGLRRRFTSARSFFAWRRRSFAARFGLVGRRRLGDSNASPTMAWKRARTASRLRCCDLCSDPWRMSTPSLVSREERRSMTRSR